MNNKLSHDFIYRLAQPVYVGIWLRLASINDNQDPSSSLFTVHRPCHSVSVSPTFTMAMSRFVVTLGLCVSASAIKLFEPGDFNPEDVWVGSACEKVLRTEIDCDKYIFEFTVPEFRGQSSKDLEMADTICSDRCSDSLRNWYPKLVKECAEEDFMSDTYPTNYWLYIGNSMSSGWNQTCAKDPKTGRYCGGW